MTVQEFRQVLRDLMKEREETDNDGHYISVLADVCLSCISGNRNFVAKRINTIKVRNMKLWNMEVITDIDEYRKHCAPIIEIEKIFQAVE